MQDNIQNNIQDSNVRIYKENGCVYRVARVFENAGISILEQIISQLLDLMDKVEKEKVDV